MFNQSKHPTSPTATGHRHASRIGRRAVAIGAMVTALAVGAAGTAETAQAWSYTYAQGSAASVTLPRVNANDTQIYAAGIGIATLTIETATGPLVYRSPATTGAQDVFAVYTLQYWNGATWINQAQAQTVARIPAGYNSVRLQRASFTPTSGKGYYRMEFGFLWKVAGTATNLGTGILTANSATDFGCSSPLRPCQVGAGWVRVGKLYQIGGGW